MLTVYSISLTKLIGRLWHDTPTPHPALSPSDGAREKKTQSDTMLSSVYTDSI